MQKVERLWPRAEGRKKGDLVFSGYRVPVLQDGKVLETCCPTVYVYLALLKHALKNG